ncbi:hypothetical protein KFK09_009067 [Dendrobium nobile]|uniref:Uncharacterized protein n=1 Tax=Dendrobium nobile TaxID=94219 RepID=A0A8T3BLT8_DENNO|nr:hypothetical protein KFK09_009067 [Dendrobium nobile]
MELKSFKQVTYKKRKNSAPSYKDPMSSAKFELLKKIKAERAEMESKKIEATMRAKLLIAEAERAAKALEVAALKSPLAKASLLETRKLIAEANLSLRSIESGRLMPQESVVESQNNTITAINQVNGFHNLSSTENSDAIKEYQTRYGIEVEEGSEASQNHLPPYHPNRIESDRTETIAHDLVSRKPSDSNMGSTKRRKWVCGRLVEVED